MKQIKIILVLIIVTAATLAQAQQAKIAYINSQALLEAMPEAKEANAKLIAYANEFDSLFQFNCISFNNTNSFECLRRRP